VAPTAAVVAVAVDIAKKVLTFEFSVHCVLGNSAPSLRQRF